MSILSTGFKLGRIFAQHQRSFFLGNCLRIIFHDEARKCFLFNIEYGKNAEIHYKHREDVINVIDLHHTYVPSRYRGRGIAYLMAEEVFQYLTENKIKVTLTCPFLIEYYKDHPELKSVMHELKELDNPAP